MGLIDCYECRREISDKAVACPHCGAPKDESGGIVHDQPTLNKPPTTTQKKTAKKKVTKKEPNIRCPKCANLVEYEINDSGKKGPCPHCGKLIVLPARKNIDGLSALLDKGAEGELTEEQNEDLPHGLSEVFGFFGVVINLFFCFLGFLVLRYFLYNMYDVDNITDLWIKTYGNETYWANGFGSMKYAAIPLIVTVITGSCFVSLGYAARRPMFFMVLYMGLISVLCCFLAGAFGGLNFALLVSVIMTLLCVFLFFADAGFFD